MDFEKLAIQLAKPQGPAGIEVALAMNQLNETISKNTYKLLHLQDSDRVLEIGLGNGNFIEHILSYGSNISFTGIDLSETMIQEAIKRNTHLMESRKVDLIQAGIEKMPFWAQTFTKICTVNTLYFWQNPAGALAEVERVLSPDGFFIIAYRPYIKGKSLDFSKYGFTEYSEAEVDALLKESNFRVVDIQSEIEAPFEFQGQTHHLESAYYMLQKV